MHKGRLSLSVVFFGIFWLLSGANPASGQVSAYVTVSDTSLASGDTYQEVTVLLQNYVEIGGVEFWFNLGAPAIMDFTTDYIEVQIDTLNNDTTAVRNCKIKTAGTLVENFEWIDAHGDPEEDTSFLDCDWVKVAGMAEEGNPIPPGIGVLFKLYVDVLCIPDTTQDRLTGIFVNGNLSDPDGYRVDVEFTNSIIYLNQTYCGNLVECKCGDVNADGAVSIVDVVYTINWMFNDGLDMCPEIMGDVNPYRGVSIADIVYLINYLFNDGDAPTCARLY